MSMRATLLLTWLVSLVTAQGGGGGICYMHYSMADNDLHSFLLEDLRELQHSEFIKDPSNSVWVYVDGSTRGTELANVVTPQGDPVPADFTDAHILHFNVTIGKFVLIEDLGEINSDDPTSISYFLTTALPQCVEDGRDQWMMIMGSHGSGYGFGGDEQLGRSRRQLTASNQLVAGAIDSALTTTMGAPEKLDVLAFDACLQASLEGLKDYQNVTKYFMASEAIVPGHGFNYVNLTSQETALDLANQFLDHFVVTPLYPSALAPEGYTAEEYKAELEAELGQLPHHQAPKTLAIFDFTKIDAFYAAWDNLCEEMIAIMTPQNDTKFFPVLARSRANTVSFSGIFQPLSDTVTEIAGEDGLDVTGFLPRDFDFTMDVGHFMEVFSDNCNPNPGIALAMKLETAKKAYKDMIVNFGAGPTTSPDATGLATVWPSRRDLQAIWYKSSLFGGNDVQDLFNKSDIYYVEEAPNYSKLVKMFGEYDEDYVFEGDGTPICQCPKVLPNELGQIMFNRQVVQSEDKESLIIGASIADGVDSVLVEYGLDIFQYVVGNETEDGGSTRRHLLLQDSFRLLREKITKRKSMTNNAPSHAILPSRHVEHNSMKMNGNPIRRKSRRAQEGSGNIVEGNGDSDYFLLFGGLLYPSYGCGDFQATWDKDYYLLVDPSDSDEFIDFVYVYQEKESSSKIPVLYFPDESIKAEVQATVNDYELTLEEGEAMGGQWSELLFDPFGASPDEDGNVTIPFELVSLYASGPSGAFAQVDKYKGGFIVPIVYVEGQLGNVSLTYLLGGFTNTIIDWGEDMSLALAPVTAEKTAEGLGLSFSVIDLVAYDYVGQGKEPNAQFNYFIIEHSEDGSFESIEASEPDIGVILSGSSAEALHARSFLPTLVLVVASAFLCVQHM